MERAVDGAIRLGRAWKSLSRERRVATVAAGVLWLTLFLPWYQASVVGRSFRTRGAMPVSESFSGWASFGLIQALILILSLGVVAFLFLRAEGRAGELPGGDGWTVQGAGGLSVFLVILGLFSAPSPAGHGLVLSTGLEWGIFVALVAAAVLTWAGGRIRHSLQDDPFLAENRRASAQDQPPDAGSRRPDAESKPPAAGPEPEPVPGREEGPTRTSEPQTAAATRTAAERPTPVPADPPTEPRSSWRPAERPDWTDPERPMGWLTAQPKHQRSEEETE